MEPSRPQCAQWAMSHTIFPGRVFDASDPVVKGHVATDRLRLRQETSGRNWLEHHDAVWPYNSAFVAEVYLWLGMKQEARETFIGFLNHANAELCMAGRAVPAAGDGYELYPAICRTTGPARSAFATCGTAWR